jgi:MlaD protein
MPRQLHWSELTAGIIAAAVIGGLIVATFLFARVGALHGKKVTLYVVTDDASGVLSGTEVWLGGRKEGVVKNVFFRPPSTDTLERVVVRTEFLNEGLANVRRDSYAQIRSGGSLIGAAIVYISPGTVAFPPLHDGDTVHTRSKTAMSDLTKDVGTIRPALSALASQVKELNTKLSRPEGTLGAFRAHGLPQLPDVSAGMSRITTKATRGNGTIALATRTNLMGRASSAMAAADSIRTLLSSNKGSLGRFRRDSTLIPRAKGVLAEVDTLRALLSDPLGTIAAAHSDSVLARELSRTHSLLASLIKNAKSHPLRYINF